jgi:F0F1-type ATP synthase alpha subunit
MKTFKLFVIAFLIGTFGTFASEISKEDLKKPDIGTQIVQLLDQTEFTFTKTPQVEISFTFNSEGEIVVLKVDSTDKDVLNYIRKNLNGKTIKNPGDRDKLYNLKINLQEI